MNIKQLIYNEFTPPNTQYKTVGVQWFARVWFSLQLFPRWIQTRSENPTVLYCQTLYASVEPCRDTLIRYKKNKNSQQNRLIRLALR